MKKCIILVIVILHIISCDLFLKEKEIYGYYTGLNYKNTYDTIHLCSGGVYYRRVYDKNKKLALEMKGAWTFDKWGSIQLKKFYVNFDDDLVKFPNLATDTMTLLNISIEKAGNKIKFCTGYYEEQYCYQRIPPGN
jgi:hypothetical protein